MYLLLYFTQHTLVWWCFFFLNGSDYSWKLFLLKKRKSLLDCLIFIKLLLLKYVNYSLTVGGSLFVLWFSFEHICFKSFRMCYGRYHIIEA